MSHSVAPCTFGQAVLATLRRRAVGTRPDGSSYSKYNFLHLSAAANVPQNVYHQFVMA